MTRPGDPPRDHEPDTLVTPGGKPIYVEEEEATDLTAVNAAYLVGQVLGRGGMGEVVLAHDRRIGRDVAIKRLRSGTPSDDDVARFMREARIQSRLDHPSIVPVYELGRDDKNRPYFTMKRLAGTTLSEILQAPNPPLQRLLRAFADVCRAIDFAHTRGVVHRDLKPANIVVGEFGDSYVLDWGVARVVEGGAGVVTADIDTLEGAAPEGKVLGTPGYMAPEQLSTPDVDRPADVYALGAILFELLAGEPVHPRGPAAITSTMGDPQTSPARRRPDRTIPPELDALCLSMLAKDPSLRPNVRRVAERIEDFLDGDRDVARRRTLAIDLVWIARAALDDGRRADAMHAAGRALALDPETPGAAEIITMLMLEPPKTPPPELVKALHQADAVHVRRRAGTAMLAYLAIASFLPVAMWNGVRKWDVVLGVVGMAIIMALAALRIRQRPERGLFDMMIYALGNVLLLVMLSRMVGPFTFVPALVCFMTTSIMSYPAFVGRPVLLVLTMIVGFTLPIVLEEAGVLGKTWELVDGALVSHAGALAIHGDTSVWMVIIASIATILMAGIHSATIAKASRQAHHQVVMQAWHLRQLLPATRAASHV
ncbi:MAG TPA: serine/threonine-protein kinase [Kofleriaceae bacterium]|nr:serine/threonine-protein kinase [Kofleriaceae bacterium]